MQTQMLLNTKTWNFVMKQVHLYVYFPQLYIFKYIIVFILIAI